MSRERETIIERRDLPKKYSLTLEEVKKIAEKSTREGKIPAIPVCRTLPADIYTPVLTYMQLVEKTGQKENEKSSFSPSFLLESVEGGERVGRYSYIGISPKEGIIVRGNEISELKDGIVTSLRAEDKAVDPLKEIQNKLGKEVAKTPDSPPFVGGWVGYLGYEVASAFEPKVPASNPDVIGVADTMLFNFDSVVAFDHVKHEIKVISDIDVENINDLERQYAEATSKIDQIVDKIHSPIRFTEKKSEGNVVHNKAESNFEKEEYLKVIKKAKDYIVAGDIIQVVVSQRWRRKTNALPFSIYRALSRVNPSPFMVYFDYGDFQIIGASPELLVKVEEEKISTWPIAGTRPRGKTPEEDEKLTKELLENEKERAEHIMLVDLARNDVGRVAAPGTVEVLRLMEVENFSHVKHMTSEVVGKRAPGKSSLDALRSIFPAGTVSGAPKIRAMQIIDEMETEKRGPYAGAIGYISNNGDLEMAITIRTIVFKDGAIYVQAGGGIVYDSDPEAEYEETIAKSRGSLRAVDLAEEEY